VAAEAKAVAWAGWAAVVVVAVAALAGFERKPGPPHRAGAAALVAMEGEGEGAADWAREEAVTGVVVWAA